MINDNYARAYKEVIEILKFVPAESVNKIPKTIIKGLQGGMDKNYDFEIDINKSFEEQELLKETKAILANIFRDYWATPYQKERISTKEQEDRQKSEEEKKSKYNSKDIFDIKTSKGNVKKVESSLPREIKREKFFDKLVSFIKKLLKNRKG